MKKTTVFKKIRWLAIFLVIAFTTTTVLASPYTIASFWMADPLDPGHEAPPEGTDPSSAVEGYWWRDTTNQNVIAQHSEDQFNSEAYQIYVSSKPRVYVYSSPSGANTTAIVSTNGFYIVGPGGGKTEAMVAKNALQRIYPPISYKNLLGVIYTGATPQKTWGSEYWRFSFYSNPLAPVYTGPGYTEALAERSEVETAIAAREDKAYGRVRGVDANCDPTVSHMAWGPDGFLGLGSMTNYRPKGAWITAWYASPTNQTSRSGCDKRKKRPASPRGAPDVEIGIRNAQAARIAPPMVAKKSAGFHRVLRSEMPMQLVFWKRLTFLRAAPLSRSVARSPRGASRRGASGYERRNRGSTRRFR